MPISYKDIWDTAHVKQQLRSETMPEWKIFIYFLAITVFDWVQFTTFRLAPTPDPVPNHVQVEAWVSLAITAIGIIYLYLCNGGIRGRNFLQRYFSLSVVVGIKFVLISIVLYWFHGLVVEDMHPDFQIWSSTTILIAINIAMFARTGIHLRGIVYSEPV
jgi:hypothetical protein